MFCLYRELRTTVRKDNKEELHATPEASVAFGGLSRILQRRRSGKRTRFPVQRRNSFIADQESDRLCVTRVEFYVDTLRSFLYT